MKIRYVKKLENEAAHMTVGKEYIVICIEADKYRIINDFDDPCLYEPVQCEVIDSIEPSFWISELGEDGERYAYPHEWNKIGFFEDYHDRVQLVVDQFWQDCKRLYDITSNV